MTAPLCDGPVHPWTIARAIWPGAFGEVWQDLQIHEGRGNWPTVATCWRPPRSWRVWIRSLVLHPSPSLRWRYADEAPTTRDPNGPATLKSYANNRRRADETHRQVRALGYRYFVPVFPASALGDWLPEVRDVVAGQRFRPSVDAFARLVESGAFPPPRAGSRGADALAKHGRREQRIAAKYPDGLPLFGGT